MNWKKGTALVLAGAMSASVLLAGCGSKIDQDAVVATLGDKEITLGFANFAAQYQAITYDSYFLSTYGEDMWSKDIFGSGSTLTESVKSMVMQNIETNYVLEQHMADYNVEITEDELNKMKEAAAQFMEDNSSSTIKALGAKEEYVEEMLRLDKIQKRMKDAIEAETDTEVSDEEAAQRTFSYIQISGSGYYDDSNQFVQYTDEEKTALADTVKDVAAAAKEDFDTAAETNGYTVKYYSYGSEEDNSTMDAAVTTAADGLKEGEISDLITTDSGDYYIIRLDKEFDEDATATRKDEIVTERKTTHYNEVLDGYKEEGGFEIKEDVWAAVNFDELYTVKTTQADTEAVSDTEAATETGTNTDTEAATETVTDTEAVGNTEQ